MVFLAIVCDLYSTLYVSDTCGTSLAAAAPINGGGVCVARAYETMRTYVFFARCYHWTAWFLDLFTDPIFGQLYAFVLRVAAARVAWASEARSRAGRREAGGPGAHVGARTENRARRAVGFDEIRGEIHEYDIKLRLQSS